MERDRQQKKIVFFHLHLQAGGVERQLCYLVNGLAAYHDVFLSICEKTGEFQELIDDRVSVESLDIPYRHRLQPGLFIGLIRVLRRERPDCLVCLHAKLHWIAVIAARIAGVKVVCGFRGFVERGPLRVCHRMILNLADGLVAVSHGVKQSLTVNIGIAADRIAVIENGVDSERIREMAVEQVPAAQRDLFREGKTFISIGRLQKGKGFDILLDALSGMRADCTLLVVGDGPERGRLEEQVSSLGISDRVVLLGTQINPYKYLNRSDFFVLASESEGFPNVILEAMSLGVPCICADYRGGTKGLIAHGETGYLVTAGDREDLRQALEYFLSPGSAEVRSELAAAGRAQVRDKFAMPHYINNYCLIIESISRGDLCGRQIF